MDRSDRLPLTADPAEDEAMSVTALQQIEEVMSRGFDGMSVHSSRGIDHGIHFATASALARRGLITYDAGICDFCGEESRIAVPTDKGRNAIEAGTLPAIVPSDDSIEDED
jgi:hypothetical protein